MLLYHLLQQSESCASSVKCTIGLGCSLFTGLIITIGYSFRILQIFDYVVNQNVYRLIKLHLNHTTLHGFVLLVNVKYSFVYVFLVNWWCAVTTTRVVTTKIIQADLPELY